MKAKYIFTITLLIVLVSSCEKSLVYIEDQFDPRVVINCVLKPGTKFSVDLSMSKSILDESDTTIIPAADINLFEDDKLVVNIPHEAATNWFNFLPQEDKNYRLEVQAKNKKFVSETCIPKPIPILKIDTAYIEVEKTQYYYSWRQARNLKLSVSIDDPSGEENYYRLLFRQKYYQRNGYGYGNQDTIHVLIDEYTRPLLSDPVFGEVSYENENPFDLDKIVNSFQIFDDALFDGKSKKIDVTFQYLGTRDMMSTYGKTYGSEEWPFEGKDTIMNRVDLTIYLQSLSKEAYLYLSSRNAYNSTNGDEFVEPVPVYTNIDGGGLGIFMGISQDSCHIEASRQKFY